MLRSRKIAAQCLLVVFASLPFVACVAEVSEPGDGQEPVDESGEPLTIPLPQPLAPLLGGLLGDGGITLPLPTPPADGGLLPIGLPVPLTFPNPQQLPQPNPVNCPTTLTSCGGVCVNVATDTSNCGFCGNACAAGNGCIAGICASACLPLQTRCGSVCTSLLLDAQNCGVCGNACGAGRLCLAGTCLP